MRVKLGLVIGLSIRALVTAENRAEPLDVQPEKAQRIRVLESGLALRENPWLRSPHDVPTVSSLRRDAAKKGRLAGASCRRRTSPQTCGVGPCETGSDIVRRGFRD